VRPVLRDAAARLRRRPARALLAALGVFAAAAMLGTAVVVSLGLSTGFERAASRSGLPDVIAHFDPQPLARVDRRLAALPNLAGRSYRYGALHVPLGADGHDSPRGDVEVTGTGRRGYAIVAGRDAREGAPEVVVERGLARAWGFGPGESLHVGRLGFLRVVGEAVAPDNVAFPLASAPRVYLTRSYLERRFGREPVPMVNEALVWVHDRRALDVTLAQARATSFGISGLRFVTRDGIRVLVDQAAGIVVALLVAISLVALAVAGVMLAASARAEVARSLPAMGIRRALGFSRARVVAAHGAEAALVAAPAAALGLTAGALLAAGPSGRLLEALNELPPGAATLAPLAAAWIAVLALVTAGSTWPAWRSAGAAPAALLRGAELPSRPPARSRGGLAALGVRLVAARRARLAATVAVLTVASAFLALMLALGSLLTSLEQDPGSVGKRYALTVSAPSGLAPAVRALPGVAAVAPRLEMQAADSFSLGETLKLVAYPGDHTAFEAPALASGRRVRADGEAEVGLGLASALGLEPGAVLAAQLSTGREARFRVVGIVRALDNDGRIAYVRPPRLLAAGAPAADKLAVRVRPGTSAETVRAELAALTSTDGSPPAVASATGAATSTSAPFLGTVAALVRAIAALDALVCLFAVGQALALSARERRGTVALLRALGTGRAGLARLFGGSAAALVVPAALLGVLLERFVFGPLVARLAAGYVTLPLTAGPLEIALVLLGLGGLAAGAALWTAWRAERDPITAGLREE